MGKINKDFVVGAGLGVAATGFVLGGVIGVDSDKAMKATIITMAAGVLIASIGLLVMEKASPEETKSNFVKGERKCWCAGPHGMVQCPCGGNSDKK